MDFIPVGHAMSKILAKKIVHIKNMHSGIQAEQYI